MKIENPKLKIVFMGTPEFGAVILEELVKNGYKPALVVTETDKPVGRKHIVTPPLVKTTALRYDIPIAQPERIKNLKLEIENLRPDLIIIAAYGKIIPKEILDIPKYGSLNVHPSLLPRWRGPSPIQYAILNGDEETGVTIMLPDEQMDHGKILSSTEYRLSGDETHENLLKELTNLGAKLLVDSVPKYINKEIKPMPQDDSKATYSKILKKEDGKIDWKKTAQEIERQIRALNPWPGTFCGCEENKYKIKTIKIHKAKIQEQTENGPVGICGKTFMATNEQIAVQTGKDYLIIEELQIEGGKKMPVKDFLKGHLEFIGIILI